VLLQSLLQKPNVTLPDVNAILSAALAQHNANVQVRAARKSCACFLQWILVWCIVYLTQTAPLLWSKSLIHC
jgi:hypothetical protein